MRIQRYLYREVDEIWQYRTGGNLTIFDKDHDTAGSRGFLQPSIRLRYNYYVQLVATKRGRMRVPNVHYPGASRCKCLLALPIVRRTPPVLLGKMGLVSDGLARLERRPY
jgi:hypothetical protein